jgi:hypothetical protein
MSAYYTIVQYVPNPLTDERMNIGIIAASDGGPAVRFINDWRRAKAFGQEDVGFLKDFASSIGSLAKSQLPLYVDGSRVELDKNTLDEISKTWKNSIQLTAPRASLKDSQALVKALAGQFLRETFAPQKKSRDRRAAVALGVRVIQNKLADRALDAEAAVTRNVKLMGKLDSHSFGFTVGDGGLYSAVQGLSFEGHEHREIRKEIDATAWAIDDVMKVSRKPETQFGVIALGSKQSKTFERAARIFKGLGAIVIAEQEVDSWAVSLASRIAAAA